VYVAPRGGGYALQATRNFTSASTPFALFDEGPVGELLGPIPSFDVVMTDLEATDGSFEGVVMIDNEGYVVWYFDAGEKVEAFDQFPGPECVAGRRRRLARVRAVTRARVRAFCSRADENAEGGPCRSRASRAPISLPLVSRPDLALAGTTSSCCACPPTRGCA